MDKDSKNKMNIYHKEKNNDISNYITVFMLTFNMVSTVNQTIQIVSLLAYYLFVNVNIELSIMLDIGT